MLRARTEVVLNLLIVGLIGVNIMVGIQVLTRDTTGLPAASERSTTTVPRVVVADVEPAITGTSSPPRTTGVQQSLRNAAVTVQSLYVENGTLPATAFELERSVPGLRIVDGVDRVTEDTIGFVTTASSSLLVGTGGENEWYCIAIDVSVPSITYGRGGTRDAVGSIGECRGPSDDWA